MTNFEQKLYSRVMLKKFPLLGAKKNKKKMRVIFYNEVKKTSSYSLKPTNTVKNASRVWGRFCLLIGISSIAFFVNTEAFYDVGETDPHLSTFNHLRDVGIMKGSADGNFYPEKLMTRAEALTVALRSGGISIPQYSGEIHFNDVDPNAWYASTVARAVETNVIRPGYTNFRPEQAVSKAEFLTFLFRATLTDLKPHYSSRNVASDIPNDSWMVPYFDYAKRYQIAHLPADDLYRPAKALSKREVALMTYRQLKLFHGNDETKLLVELNAAINQFLELIRNGKNEEAEFQVHRLLQLNEKIARTRNSSDAVAALAISRSMEHLSESFRYFRYGNNLRGIENLHLALKQARRAQEKSVAMEGFAQELANIISESLITYTQPSLGRYSQN